MKIIITLIFFLFGSVNLAQAQDSLINELSKNYLKTFTPQDGSFQGDGWDEILQKVRTSNYVLVGEDHLMNEVPVFCSVLLKNIKFDNFFCEIDPFSARILGSKIKDLSDSDFAKFVATYGNTFSFFAMTPELDLLKQVVSNRTNIFGIDQILIVADRLICAELKLATKDTAAAAIYKEIEEQSKVHFENFLRDPAHPFYMLTPDFEKKLSMLSDLKLSDEEMKVMDRLKLTARIYKQQNHHLRVQLIKSQLMEEYENWKDRKSIFKYGAVHTPKGQSLRDIYDIGNLLHNVADSKFQKSLHIMIVAKSGFQASPFKGFPNTPVNVDSDDLKTLKPFFSIDSGDNWQCFDLAALNKTMGRTKPGVFGKKMTQILEGYDLLIVIPAATPAKFAF